MSNDTQSRLFFERKNGEAFDRAVTHARSFIENAETRRPFPSKDELAEASTPIPGLPSKGLHADQVIDEMQKRFEKPCVNSIGGRFFGFVTGGSTPASIAARILSDVWDQNAPLYRTSPSAAIAEDIAEAWLKDLFGLPEETVAGFVSGSSLAIFCGLAAARWRILRRQGWDLNKHGLRDAPPMRVIAGRHAHGTVVKAVTLLGIGTDNVEWIDVDQCGRIKADELPPLDDRTILVLQAGNVNGGAFDDFKTLCKAASEAGAWTHIDGAFGLWAAASDNYRHLTAGMEDATSWSCDAHKTLNTPYDCGIIFCRDQDAIRSALHQSGSYLEVGGGRDGMYMTPELSRRARAFDVWAALLNLGRDGVDDLVSMLCERTAQFAEDIVAAGFELMAPPDFNQLLFACETDEETERVLRSVQESGECWTAGAEWFGRRVIRISICSWATTKEDVDRAVAAFAQARKDQAVDN